MNSFDWIILCVIIFMAFFALRHIIKAKKSGRCIGCGKSCDNCGNFHSCPNFMKRNENNNEEN